MNNLKRTFKQTKRQNKNCYLFLRWMLRLVGLLLRLLELVQLHVVEHGLLLLEDGGAPGALGGRRHRLGHEWVGGRLVVGVGHVREEGVVVGSEGAVGAGGRLQLGLLLLVDHVLVAGQQLQELGGGLVGGGGSGGGY